MKNKNLVGLVILFLGLVLIYYQFFLLGKIPIPADLLVGAYYPWLDYKWGYPTGVPVKNPPITDVISQLYLWRNLAFDFLKQGIWPLWNPYSSSGIPLLANFQSAPFLPFNMLLLLPKYWGWGIYIFSQSLIAALGMYFLLGIYKLNIFSKVAGGLVFSLAGLMTTYVEFAFAGFAASTLPWLIYVVEKFCREKKPYLLIVLSLILTFLYLSGHVQLILYGSALLIIYLFYLFISKKIYFKQVFLIIVFLFLGIGISSLQLLPGIEHLISSSIRTKEVYSLLINYGLSPWYELIRFIAADFFGNPTTYNYWDRVDYHEHSIFLGTITLPLITLFIFKRFRNSLTLFWLFIFIGSLFLAIDNPITKFFYSLPITLITNSAASRVFFLTSFSAAILLGFSIDNIQKELKFRNFFWLSNLFYLILLIIIFISISILIVSDFDNDIIPEALNKNLSVSLRNLILPIIILSIFLISRFLFLKKFLIYLILIILFLDLGRYFLKHNPFVDQSLIYPETPLIEFLQKQESHFRIARGDLEILPPNTWTIYSLYSAEGYDPLSLENYGHYVNKINGKPFEEGLSRYVHITNFPSKFLDAVNVKYILAVKRDKMGHIPGAMLNKTLQPTNYKVVFEDKNSVVLENPDYLNRAYFVNKIYGVSNKQQLRDIIDRPDFDPKTEAVVEGYNQNKIFNTNGQIQIIEYLPTKVAIKTNVKEKSFMVFADTYENGWQVSENGKGVKLYQVNGALRGVFIQPGENTYIFTYWPTSFALGLRMSFLSLGIIMIISTILLFGKNDKKSIKFT